MHFSFLALLLFWSLLRELNNLSCLDRFQHVGGMNFSFQFFFCSINYSIPTSTGAFLSVRQLINDVLNLCLETRKFLPWTLSDQSRKRTKEKWNILFLFRESNKILSWIFCRLSLWHWLWLLMQMERRDLC